MTRLSLLLCAALFALNACSRDTASDSAAPPEGVQVGQRAPALELPNEAGQAVSLADLRSKSAVLLAFYPKNFTGG